jgi:hypothetical protein
MRFIEKDPEKFNFYFAKPISEILSKCQLPHVVQYKEIVAWNSEKEYLKKYYPK